MEKIDKEQIRYLCEEDRNIAREDKINELVEWANKAEDVLGKMTEWIKLNR